MAQVFAERLKQAREERGWSLAKLGYAAEMSREQVAHYECGRKEPRLKCLIRLADALDCSLDFLAGRED
ncbi:MULTISPECIES: helix-turn-helix domain-containing protein [Ralstonia]|uniref:HTH cro/C1-type domain-containing protein n=1 Tax=Ralstonia condita TaxID=3058600 RepID=A0ABN9ID90_9RALS|nr:MULTISPECIES: helix-turn-helix transcriptional regulator [Ralstonia]MBB0023649.1 XRE family transcriptional regulator [Ralstonia pickettii]MBB0096992.1 XRE family transcriptional regulator [Ralstonia pickettii]MBB0107038.1 XRE family transcriptional regulator [Ralstonia pickettii]MBB0127765.1 XRE family transcriptional regulator [Ralstonia pickettii]MBB0160738.1 XRE family transcriptional regulator [Ralstonia pickettii]